MLQKINPFSGVSASGGEVTSGTVSFANSNNVSFGLSGNTLTGSVAGSGFDVSLAGNTAGTLGLVSTGTLILAGGNNITLSQNGNSVTISAPNSASPQTGISSIAASGGTQTNGMVSFSNANGITFGMAAGAEVGTITASYTVPSTDGFISDINVSAGTTSNNLSALTFSNSNGVSFGLNASTITASIATSLTDIKVSAGTVSNNLSALTFSNSNGVSFGLNASTITASVAAQSNQSIGVYASSQTAGQSSSSTVDARSFTHVGQGIVSVGLSAGSLLFSATTTQSVQTQNLIDVSIGGNTTGTLALISSGTMFLAGGNNITLSQNGQSVTISGASAGGGSGGIDVEISGNTSGTTGLVSSGTLFLAGGNNITLSQDGQSVTISGPNAAGAQTGISSVAASGGTQTVGEISFSNANGITFGMSTGAETGIITASYTVPSTAGLLSDINVSAGTTSNNLSALTFSNSNGVSFGLNASTITASVTPQTNQSLGLYVSSQTTGQSSSSTVDARSFTHVGQGIVSVGLSAGSLLFSATTSQSVQTQNCIDVTLAGNTTGTLALVSQGTLTLAGGNNIVLSQNGNAITISGPNVPGAQTGISSVAASGGTQTAGQISFVNSNGITFGMSTGPNTGTITASYTVPSTAGLLSDINISAGTTSNNLSALTFSNSNGISFGLNASTLTASYTVPSTAGLISDINVSAGTTSNNLSALTFSNSNGVSFGLNASTITASVASQSVQTQNCVDASIAGNTAGTPALISSGTLILAGGNNITLSQNGNTVTISGAAGGGGGAGITGVADSANTQTTGLLSFANSNGVTFGLSTGASAATLTASVATGGGGGGAYQSFYANIDQLADTQTFTVNGSTSTIFPFKLMYPMTISYVRIPVSGSLSATISCASTASTSFGATGNTTWYAQVYSQASTTQNVLASVARGTASMAIGYQLTANAGSNMTFSNLASYPIMGGSSTTSFTNAFSTGEFFVSTASMTGFTAVKFLDIPFANSLAAGAYWMLLGCSTTTSTAGATALGTQGCIWNTSGICGSQMANTFGYLGQVTNSSIALLPGLGSITASTMVFDEPPASFPMSSISSATSHRLPYFQMLYSMD